MRFLWVGWAGGGAVPPQLALCEALLEAGHEVIAVADGRLRPEFERSGVRFDDLDEPPRPMDATGPEIERWVLTQKFIGDAYATAMAEGIARHRPDRVLVDGTLFSAQVEARAAGVPYVALWHMLMSRADEWRGGIDAQDQAENLASHNAHRTRSGLLRVGDITDTLLDATLLLAFSYDVLNHQSERTWPNLHFVGAPTPNSDNVELQIPSGDAPLVLVGFSTTPMGQASALNRVLEALAELDVRVLVTLGPLRAQDLDLPANATSAPFVPHDQVLPDAALTVSHAGHGTMCAAVRHGVPILAMPLGRDQPTNARVLTDLGIGASLSPTASPAEIAQAVQRLLDDESVRKRCSEIAAQIADHPTVRDAVELLTTP